jgi:hypothetical protein
MLGLPRPWGEAAAAFVSSGGHVLSQDLIIQISTRGMRSGLSHKS